MTKKAKVKDEVKKEILKKSSLLSAIPDEPIKREDLQEQLDQDYEFLPSFFDYLIDHFENQGKIHVNEADGTIWKKVAGSSSKPRSIFCVVIKDESYQIITKEQLGNISDEDKENGWTTTQKSAVKKMKSNVFAQYKEDTATLTDLIDAEPTEVIEDVEDESESDD